MQVFGNYQQAIVHRGGIANRRRTPEVDCRAYRLSISGLVKRPVIISLSTIKHLFSKVTVSGENREAGEERGAAEWGGVPLREILDYAGLKFAARHVAFTGLDEFEVNSQLVNSGGSIPVAAALNPEVILAYEMNGQPLTPEHGAPLCLVIPGQDGTHSIKWVGEIKLLASSSTHYFQRLARRLSPPQVKAGDARGVRGLISRLTDAWHRIGLFAPNPAARRKRGFANHNHWQQAKF
jgi:sulfite oxidase